MSRKGNSALQVEEPEGLNISTLVIAWQEEKDNYSVMQVPEELLSLDSLFQNSLQTLAQSNQKSVAELKITSKFSLQAPEPVFLSHLFFSICCQFKTLWQNKISPLHLLLEVLHSYV